MKSPKIFLGLSLLYAVNGYGQEVEGLYTPDTGQYQPLPENQVNEVFQDPNNRQFFNGTSKPEADTPKAGTMVSLVDILSNTKAYPAILSAQADINANQGDKSAAEMQRFPTFSAGVNASDSSRISPVLQIQQPLWTGGRITGQIEEAEHQVASSEAKLHDTTYNIQLKAVSAWQNLIDTQNSVKINTEVLGYLESYKAFMQRRVAAGVSPQIELQLVLTRLQQVEADMRSAKAINKVAKIQIQQLTNYGYTDVDLDHIPSLQGQVDDAKKWLKARLREDYGEFLENTVAEYPAVLKAQKDVEVLEARYKVKKAAYMPTVNLSYQYTINRPDNFNNSNDNRIMLGVNFQPGAGLSSYESAKAAAIRAEGAKNAIETAKLDILESLNTDIQDALSNQQREDMLNASVDASSLVLDSYKRQFVAGKRTWFDVMNALRELTQNKLAVAHTKASLVGSTYKLMVKSGEFKPYNGL